MPELSIRKIIEKTLSGEIRIPSFQRGFVWEPEKVAFFIDSLYKGYPIGSLLFWRTNIRLENERQLGNYSLPEPTKGYAEPGISGICHTARRYFPEGEDHSRQDRLNDPVSCGRIYRHAAVLRLQPVPASGGFAGSGGIRHGLHHVVLL